jgi:O-antigen ligase
MRQKLDLLKRLGLAATAISVIVFAGLFSMRDSYFVRNVIFHADESTVQEDPNELRKRFWQESLSGIAEEPLGHGPGTAGLASIHNQVQGVELNENYYLQIAYEAGIIGLILFMAILGIVALDLYRLEKSMLAKALLASLAGLMITNFLVHIWSNEAVAYTWWGLAGLIIRNTDNKSKTLN